jgi:hypothetical protein
MQDENPVVNEGSTCSKTSRTTLTATSNEPMPNQKEELMRLILQSTGNVPRRMEKARDGYMVVLNLPASRALAVWEHLANYMRIFVDWTGEMDIEPEELSRRIARILKKMKVEVFFTTKEPVDAVELVEEAWK